MCKYICIRIYISFSPSSFRLVQDLYGYSLSELFIFMGFLSLRRPDTGMFCKPVVSLTRHSSYIYNTYIYFSSFALSYRREKPRALARASRLMALRGCQGNEQPREPHGYISQELRMSRPGKRIYPGKTL